MGKPSHELHLYPVCVFFFNSSPFPSTHFEFRVSMRAEDDADDECPSLGGEPILRCKIGTLKLDDTIFIFIFLRRQYPEVFRLQFPVHC